MPNHVTNILEVTGEDKDIQEVFAHIKGENGRIDFDKIKPMPESLNITSDGFISLLENQFSQGETLKTALDRYRDRDNFVYNEDMGKTIDNLAQGIKNYLQYGHASWYGWKVANWGTKWNAYDIDECGSGDNLVSFDTAWSSPRKLILLLSEQLPKVKFNLAWADEDTGSNVGKVSYQGGMTLENYVPENGSKESYELAFEVNGGEEHYELKDGKYEYIEGDE